MKKKTHGSLVFSPTFTNNDQKVLMQIATIHFVLIIFDFYTLR
jgi:hypothetical protein